MRAFGQKTSRELLTGLAALVVAILAQTIIVWGIVSNLQRIDRADDGAREEIFQYDAMLDALSDQEIGLRDFMLERSDRALARYRSGREKFDAGVARLRFVTSDDPRAMRLRTEDLIRQVDVWNRRVAEPQIAAARSSEHSGDPEAGRAYVERARADFAYLRQNVMERLEGRDGLWGEAFRESRITLLVGSALALAFAISLGWRSIARHAAHQAAEQAAAEEIADALERAQAAERAKSIFLANMSHEMLTPLNGVAGMAQALGQTELSAKQRGLLTVIGDCASDLEGLIDNLLTLTRDERRAPERETEWAFDLESELRVIAADYAEAARAKGLRFSLEVDPGAGGRVRADAARLERVLTCLLSNAVKFTERGSIALGVGRAEGDRYRFQVTDTGVGFDLERKAALFRRFAQFDNTSTRRFGGAGIGLAVAHQAARELGGRLDVRSAPGVGSIFTLEVELSAADAEPAADTRAPLAPAA